MKELNNKELLQIDGGAGITAAFLNAASRGISTVLELGRSLGSAIRRISSNNLCTCSTK